MKTPDADTLTAAIRACVDPYVNANRGSDEHALGHCETGTLNEMLPGMANVPSVKAGFAVRFKDGTIFLVNVHEIPGSKPKP